MGFGVMHESPINHCAHRNGVYISVDGIIVIDDRVCNEALLNEEMRRKRGVKSKQHEKSQVEGMSHSTSWDSKQEMGSATRQQEGADTKQGKDCTKSGIKVCCA